eukprot:TRINITY_DN2392_c0_g1_i1.p1 TRINITY_DN2392_c0_g1~~TRINITY_DN2392_c0_g1_i1.p1  ORF type:complete len:412 (-),score=139.92 TRINITY_DN2392_c0_g1_i1:52-1287(-)
MPKIGIEDLGDLKGKKVLIRVDFNVPQNKDGSVANDLRIRAALPTIKKVTDAGGRAILMSHLGRPAEKGYEEKYSLKPVASKLSELLGHEATFAADCLNAAKEVEALKDGQVLLLENLRFYSNEGAKKEEDRMDMAKKLAAYADFYVSDAFGTAHRDAASMTGVPKVLGKGAAGLLMKKEIDYFEAALLEPKRPLLAILGGAKVSDKIQVIKNMLNQVNSVIIGGAMAYTFLKYLGKHTGKSKVETEADGKDGKIDIVKLAGELLEEAKKKNVKVLLPVDHVTNSEFKDTDSPHVTQDDNIPDDQMALDIGPKTIELYTNEIKNSKVVIWNGPMGVFELEKGFSKGTWAIARTLAESPDILSVVGGGDSAAAAEKSGFASKLSHVSTGGGATLELLEGKVLPGVAALTDKK